jgi:hypothetical protein
MKKAGTAKDAGVRAMKSRVGGMQLIISDGLFLNALKNDVLLMAYDPGGLIAAVNNLLSGALLLCLTC